MLKYTRLKGAKARMEQPRREDREKAKVVGRSPLIVSGDKPTLQPEIKSTPSMPMVRKKNTGTKKTTGMKNWRTTKLKMKPLTMNN